MKRLFSLLLILCSFLWGDAQPVVNRAGAPNTVHDPNLFTSRSFRPPVFADTVSANLVTSLDSCGKQIYTYDVDGYWYRACFPQKHWARVLDQSTPPLVNEIEVITDSSITICSNGSNISCDTITVNTDITIATAFLSNDSTLIVCESDGLTCDTVTIPRQRVYMFQNGLTSLDGIQEWGGALLHNTEIYGGEKTITFRAHPVYNYVFKVQNMQRYSDGTGLQSWLSAGNGAIDTARDYGNLVRLGLNYTGAAYPAGATNLPGYFGDKIGYFLGTNTTGAGSYGLSTDDDSAKVGGVFFHTLDRNYTDAVTIYGKAAPNASLVAQIASGQTLAPDRIATFHNNRNLTFYGYDSTSRNDGVLTKVLGTDAEGNVLLGRIAAASVSGGTDTHFANTDLTATGNRTHDWAAHSFSLSNASDINMTATGTMGGDDFAAILQADPTDAGFSLQAIRSYSDGSAAMGSLHLWPNGSQFSNINADGSESIVAVGGVNNGNFGIELDDDSGHLWVTNLPYTSDPVYKVLVRDTVTGKVAYTDLSVSPFVDTSGRTYYALNGLSARNDSTFQLGGTLDMNTKVYGAGGTYGIYLDSMAYVAHQTFGANYKLFHDESGDYYKLEQTYLSDNTLRNRFYWNTQNMYFDNYQGAYYFSAVTSHALAGTQAILGIDEDDKIFKVSGLPEYTDNAAAITGGLSPGEWYHTAGVVKIVLAP